MVKRVILNINLSKASGCDCIPGVILKNFEPEFSYILAELFNMCPKKSSPDSCKVSLAVPVFKNVWRKINS